MDWCQKYCQTAPNEIQALKEHLREHSRPKRVSQAWATEARDAMKRRDEERKSQSVEAEKPIRSRRRPPPKPKGRVSFSELTQLKRRDSEKPPGKSCWSAKRENLKCFHQNINCITHLFHHKVTEHNAQMHTQIVLILRTYTHTHNNTARHPCRLLQVYVKYHSKLHPPNQPHTNNRHLMTANVRRARTR